MGAKILLYAIFIIITVIAQTALFASGFWLIKDLNLILVLAVILITLADFDVVMVYLVLSGLYIDLYSNLPFGLITLCLILSAFTLEILFYNFFTNRSFYSLIIMGIITVFLYNAIFLAASGLLYLLGWSDFFAQPGYLSGFFGQIIGTTLLLLVSFSFINSLSRRFKPIFINS